MAKFLSLLSVDLAELLVGEFVILNMLRISYYNGLNSIPTMFEPFSYSISDDPERSRNFVENSFTAFFNVLNVFLNCLGIKVCII